MYFNFKKIVGLLSYGTNWIFFVLLGRSRLKVNGLLIFILCVLELDCIVLILFLYLFFQTGNFLRLLPNAIGIPDLEIFVFFHVLLLINLDNVSIKILFEQLILVPLIDYHLLH